MLATGYLSNSNMPEADLAYGRINIGVDCGATNIRVLAMHDDGRVISTIKSPGRLLQKPVDRSWAVILDAIAACFSDAGLPFIPRQCIVGIGVAGGHNERTLSDFKARAPAFAGLAIDTDSFIHLLGAHNGKPGSIAAFGTGSIGETLLPGGERRLVGGYGFPAGDRASGAWLGQMASQHLQDAFDGVVPFDDFAEALREAMDADDRSDALAWLVRATPSDFGSLVPVVLAHRKHPTVQRLLATMAHDAEAMIAALQTYLAGPTALCGGLAAVIEPLLPEEVRDSLVRPASDGAWGAIALVRQQLSLPPIAWSPSRHWTIPN